mgnify:CR=1 FL=1
MHNMCIHTLDLPSFVRDLVSTDDRLGWLNGEVVDEGVAIGEVLIRFDDGESKWHNLKKDASNKWLQIKVRACALYLLHVLSLSDSLSLSPMLSHTLEVVSVTYLHCRCVRVLTDSSIPLTKLLTTDY